MTLPWQGMIIEILAYGDLDLPGSCNSSKDLSAARMAMCDRENMILYEFQCIHRCKSQK
jgi:hypothetical protein